jgi:hypothetical protein
MTNEFEKSPDASAPIATSQAQVEKIQDRVKTASKDAMSAFKIFAFNPVGDLSTAFDSLGMERALKVGLVFGLVFAIMLAAGIRMMIPDYYERLFTFGGYIKLIIASFVPFIGLVGGNYIARLACHGEGSMSHDVFVAGASALPIAIFVLISAVVGIANIEVIALLSIVAQCLTILMLFAGQTRICKMSEKLATISVPLILLLSAWLSKIIWMSFAKSLMGLN